MLSRVENGSAPVLQIVSGATFHASQSPLIPPVPCSTGGVGTGLLLIASGTIQSGSCPVAAVNCVQFIQTAGGFQVQGIEAGGFQPGDLLSLVVPVVDTTGASQGFRTVLCGPADPSSQVLCNASVNEPGISPQLGGTKNAVVNRSLNLLLPPPPPPPLLLLPPPPPPLLVPPPVPAVAPSAAPAFPEVPVIPETDSAYLVVGGLVALAGLVGLRRLRRHRDEGS